MKKVRIFILAKSLWKSPCVNVLEGEVVGLIQAISLVGFGVRHHTCDIRN